ncbi:hypothetical protein EDB83DRAFT_2524545 [Lactarius deliciosus]|nr:hypothetical protein EDB83DRAFT_2524545 [Lactarius deliciosus]
MKVINGCDLRSRLEIILVDLEQPKSVMRLTPAESSDDLWSWSPLTTDGRKWVLASRSASTVSNELVLSRLEEHGGRPRVTWQVIAMPPLSRRGELRMLVLDWVKLIDTLGDGTIHYHAAPSDDDDDIDDNMGYDGEHSAPSLVQCTANDGNGNHRVVPLTMATTTWALAPHPH